MKVKTKVMTVVGTCAGCKIAFIQKINHKEILYCNGLVIPRKIGVLINLKLSRKSFPKWCPLENGKNLNITE